MSSTIANSTDPSQMQRRRLHCLKCPSVPFRKTMANYNSRLALGEFEPPNYRNNDVTLFIDVRTCTCSNNNNM